MISYKQDQIHIGDERGVPPLLLSLSEKTFSLNMGNFLKALRAGVWSLHPEFFSLSLYLLTHYPNKLVKIAKLCAQSRVLERLVGISTIKNYKPVSLLYQYF